MLLNSNNSSKYYSLEDLCQLIEKRSNDTSVLYANSRSLLKHIHEYKELLDCIFSVKKHSFDILCFAETWLNHENYTLANFEGYEHVMKIKQNTYRGGGLSIFIKEDINYIERSDLSFQSNQYDCIFIEIISNNTGNHNTIIGLVYRSPSYNSELEFTNKMEGILEKIHNERKEIIICGDFNMDLLKADTHYPTTALIDTMLTYQLKPCITLPTRVTNNSATLIDHIYKKISDKDSIAGTLLSDITDHYINFIFTEKKDKHVQPHNITYRPITANNITKLNNELEKADWNEVTECNEPNEAYDIFLRIYQCILNKTIPMKTINFNKSKHKKQPWMTTGILKSIQTKSKLYKQKANTRQNQNLINEKYNNYRNLLNKIIRAAKNSYWHKSFSESKNDMKQTWQNINNILQKTRNKRNFPNMFKDGDQSYSIPKDISNAFNNYYVNLGPNLANKIPQTSQAECSMPTINHPGSFFFTPTIPQEIIDIIKKLKPKTSCGCDEINSKLIKNSSLVIAQPLSHVINLSLSHGIVPNQMKIAKVLPIFKGKENNIFKNYRPISLLPSFSKILEKVVYKRLYSYFQHHELFYKAQYGFRKNFSTELALLDFKNKIIQQIHKKKQNLGIFLDLSKAFDTLQHDILLNKIKHYGIRGIPYNWFKSYLSDRRQYVNFQNYNSEERNIGCGVPQGSILGPLLFLIYMNDLHNISNDGTFILFADDTNIIYTENNLNTLETKANNDLKKVGNWFNVNKLSINTEKTKFILFQTKAREQPSTISLVLNNMQIKQTFDIKFLGITVQWNFSWDIHLNKIANKVSQINSVLSRIKKTLPKNILEIIYKSLIEPHLNYGIMTWGCALKSHMKRLNILQKRSARLIDNSKYNSHTDPIFKTKNILKLEDLFKLNCCKFYYKKLKGSLPSYHTEQLYTLAETNIVLQITRQQNNVYIHPVKSQLDKQTINYIVGNIWNSLPKNIREKSVHGFATFSSAIKKYYLSNYQENCTIRNCNVCNYLN